ncbi:RimK/LysX family protein [Vibrio ostreicida]|uniref:putative ATP-dependent zinc protease n=1 Tax=Vibrio ostreicida TaxID=526588 RepID=UPI003B5B3742
MNNTVLTMILSSALIFTPLSGSETLSATTTNPVYQVDKKLVLGRIEKVYYDGIPELENIPFTGKIDTGADTTSIHAENIVLSSRHPNFKHLNGDDLLWAIVNDRRANKHERTTDTYLSYLVTVSYTIHHPYTGKEIRIKVPLERISIVRSRSSKKPILRPAIRLPLTIGNRTVETMVNLTDRSQFSAPILIGKTFLKDNAWVMAGYDYLQEQPRAQRIGTKETIQIHGMSYPVSLTTSSRFSNAHAIDIDINKKRKQVTFKLESNHGERKTMTLPIIRFLNTSQGPRPMVYLPVTINVQQTQPWLVYLIDRGDKQSKIRLGLDMISEYFIVNTGKQHQFKYLNNDQSGLGDAPFVVSPNETLKLDDKFSVPAKPTFTVDTPLLRVSGFDISKKNGQKSVTFALKDPHGKTQSLTKPVLRTLRVGDASRPVVEGQFQFNGQQHTIEFALDKLDEHNPHPFFLLGHNMEKNGVFLNTRTKNLLSPVPLFKAGYIEVADVEGLRFPVKLDTGADVSSINAQNIKRFQKEGKDMVTFTYANDAGLTKEFTREVVDVMNIKAKAGEQANQRPVVLMRVRLNHLERTIKVNLQDRGRFHYSMILGKNFLQYGALVSSDARYILTSKPDSEQ